MGHPFVGGESEGMPISKPAVGGFCSAPHSPPMGAGTDYGTSLSYLEGIYFLMDRLLGRRYASNLSRNRESFDSQFQCV